MRADRRTLTILCSILELGMVKEMQPSEFCSLNSYKGEIPAACWRSIAMLVDVVDPVTDWSDRWARRPMRSFIQILRVSVTGSVESRHSTRRLRLTGDTTLVSSKRV